MKNELIAYECVAPEHQPSLTFPDKLTIHQGAWAFCPFDSRAEGHQWRETGGTVFGDLLRRAGIALAQEAERTPIAREKVR